MGAPPAGRIYGSQSQGEKTSTGRSTGVAAVARACTVFAGRSSSGRNISTAEGAPSRWRKMRPRGCLWGRHVAETFRGSPPSSVIFSSDMIKRELERDDPDDDDGVHRLFLCKDGKPYTVQI